MTDDQQASTLAFLQNFYTDVTLYMPFEAPERASEVVPIAAIPVAAPVPVVAAALPPPGPAPTGRAAAAPTGPPVPAAPTKLPSLAALPTAQPVEPPAAAAQVAASLPAIPVPPAKLVVPAAPAPLAPAPPAAPVAPYLLTAFSTLGSNARGVVLLVRLPEAQFQKLPRNVFLNKLLQAIQLVMADVVLVNVDGPYPVALDNLRREIAATHVLAFGKNLLDVAVRTTQIYEPVLFPNLNLAYLAAAEVEMVEYDVSLKKRLWSGLQAMFL